MNFLEEDSVLFVRIQYNNFRKGYIFDYLHNKKLIKFKNEHYLFSESLKTQLDFDRIKKDFSHYTKFTIYVCNICASNVFMSNKYVLRCNHDICYNCYKRIKPNAIKQILCPYCRNVNEISEENESYEFEIENNTELEEHYNCIILNYFICIAGLIITSLLYYVIGFGIMESSDEKQINNINQINYAHLNIFKKPYNTEPCIYEIGSLY